MSGPALRRNADAAAALEDVRRDHPNARWFGCSHCGLAVLIYSGGGGSLTCPVCAVLATGSYADHKGDNDHLQLGFLGRGGVAFYPELCRRPDLGALALAAVVAHRQLDARWPSGECDPSYATSFDAALEWYVDDVRKAASVFGVGSAESAPAEVGRSGDAARALRELGLTVYVGEPSVGPRSSVQAHVQVFGGHLPTLRVVEAEPGGLDGAVAAALGVALDVEIADAKARVAWLRRCADTIAARIARAEAIASG